jgi:hypothetical protein
VESRSGNAGQAQGVGNFVGIALGGNKHQHLAPVFLLQHMLQQIDAAVGVDLNHPLPDVRAALCVGIGADAHRVVQQLLRQLKA